jgi:hypothetical protein
VPGRTVTRSTQSRRLPVGFELRLRRAARPATDQSTVANDVGAHRASDPRVPHSEIDRESARTRALGEAKTRGSVARSKHSSDAEQAKDERALDRDMEEARVVIEKSLTQMNRFYVQISGAMLVSGPVDEAVGVESLVPDGPSIRTACVGSRVSASSPGVSPFLQSTRRFLSRADPLRWERGARFMRRSASTSNWLGGTCSARGRTITCGDSASAAIAPVQHLRFHPGRVVSPAHPTIRMKLRPGQQVAARRQGDARPNWNVNV